MTIGELQHVIATAKRAGATNETEVMLVAITGENTYRTCEECASEINIKDTAFLGRIVYGEYNDKYSSKKRVVLDCNLGEEE